MRHLIAGVLALGLSASAALAETIEDVIGQQLNAFNERDMPKAFDFASPMIKRLFGNAGNFGSMVSRGYPMVWDNSEVRFLGAREMGGSQFQKVLVKDANGGLHVLEYKMIPVQDGWQIDGVQLLPAPEVGA
ncbi:MAG: DUF4864 domain-containing protein [Yoonia sp.]|nr:DUF4864 domain-containing protein [Yoonia sp.]